MTSRLEDNFKTFFLEYLMGNARHLLNNLGIEHGKCLLMNLKVFCFDIKLPNLTMPFSTGWKKRRVVSMSRVLNTYCFNSFRFNSSISFILLNAVSQPDHWKSS